MILRLAGGKLIRWVNFLKAKRLKAPPARKNRGLKQKYSKKRVFESAAGEPKNEVFWAKSRVEPPRGVGGSPSDLMLISKITGFLNVISPMGLLFLRAQKVF